MLKTKYGTFLSFWNCFVTGVWKDFAFEGAPPMAQWRKAVCVQLGFLRQKIHKVESSENILRLYFFEGLMSCRDTGEHTLGKNDFSVLNARRSS